MGSPTATLFREAADGLEEKSAANGFFVDWCESCRGDTVPIGEKIPHTPECLITRLRVEAEKMSATGSGEGQ